MHPWVAGCSRAFVPTGARQATRLLGTPVSAWHGKDFGTDHIIPTIAQAPSVCRSIHSADILEFDLSNDRRRGARWMAVDSRHRQVVKEGGARGCAARFHDRYTVSRIRRRRVAGAAASSGARRRGSLMGEVRASIRHESTSRCALSSACHGGGANAMRTAVFSWRVYRGHAGHLRRWPAGQRW